MRKTWIPCLFCFLLLALSGCAQNEAQGSSPQNMDYDATKKMLVDILKTDDGKKAITDVLSDEKMKEQLLLDQALIKQTIEKELLSPKGEKFWQQAFKDPKFAAAYAKSMKTEHEKLMKGLMKDPAYQQLMMNILKSPEMGKEVLDLSNSPQYRKEVKKIMMETFDSPLVRAQLSEMLQKAAHDEIDQSASKKGSQGQQQQGQQQGGGQQ
ncbi:spore germination protein D [Fictibacillus enclensis]|uniref:Spore gernimation protein GerD n=1 Tax=Fictibacillus enclensis TaxID=1017270 RepID=A0A0V8IUQ6_9BACL|nr:spore germination lipoprotein GerD [Fictibacillus enclensis]KSU78485.1 spore gernimation protein GerD [Fictibacillus enclensis]SCC41010.1 spore germination protein D [Fictibacillus enclensis]